jgi:hypothetical protein
LSNLVDEANDGGPGLQESVPDTILLENGVANAEVEAEAAFGMELDIGLSHGRKNNTRTGKLQF